MIARVGAATGAAKAAAISPGAVAGGNSAKAKRVALRCGIGVIKQCATCRGASDFLDTAGACANAPQKAISGADVLDLGVGNSGA